MSIYDKSFAPIIDNEIIHSAEEGEWLKFKGLVVATFSERMELLDMLKKKYIEAASARVGCDPTFPYFREGQNDVVRLLISIMEEAKHGSI